MICNINDVECYNKTVDSVVKREECLNVCLCVALPYMIKYSLYYKKELI